MPPPESYLEAEVTALSIRVPIPNERLEHCKCWKGQGMREGADKHWNRIFYKNSQFSLGLKLVQLHWKQLGSRLRQRGQHEWMARSCQAGEQAGRCVATGQHNTSFGPITSTRCVFMCLWNWPCTLQSVQVQVGKCKEKGGKDSPVNLVQLAELRGPQSSLQPLSLSACCGLGSLPHAGPSQATQQVWQGGSWEGASPKEGALGSKAVEEGCLAVRAEWVLLSQHQEILEKVTVQVPMQTNGVESLRIRPWCLQF